MDNIKDTLTHDKIELRSEKIRDILGEVPNKFVRWGITIIFILLLILIATLSCLEFPYGDGETIFEHMFNHEFIPSN